MLLRDLECFGYDEDLNLIGSRGVVISVHSESKARLHTVPFDPIAYEEAMELPIMKSGA